MNRNDAAVPRPLKGGVVHEMPRPENEHATPNSQTTLHSSAAGTDRHRGRLESLWFLKPRRLALFRKVAVPPDD